MNEEATLSGSWVSPASIAAGTSTSSGASPRSAAKFFTSGHVHHQQPPLWGRRCSACRAAWRPSRSGRRPRRAVGSSSRPQRDRSAARRSGLPVLVAGDLRSSRSSSSTRRPRTPERDAHDGRVLRLRSSVDAARAPRFAALLRELEGVRRVVAAARRVATSRRQTVFVADVEPAAADGWSRRSPSSGSRSTTTC